MSRHACHALGCLAEIQPNLFMCRAHWFSVPKSLRDQLWATYRPGQEITKDPSSEYLEAAAACIRAAAEREGIPTEQIDDELADYAEIAGFVSRALAPTDLAIREFSRKVDGRYLHLPASNFFVWPIPAPGGRTAPTNEHYFAAAKTRDRAEQDRILAAPTAGQAKRLGRRVTLRDDWEVVELGVMRRAIEAKFADPFAGPGAWLVQTSPFELVEGNRWGDDFWGMVRGDDGKWSGQNWLGVLLMARRSELAARALLTTPSVLVVPTFDELLALGA